ncbi:YajQ family cyclic di-GMP-binding protein [Cryomorpha ignava]|uniref:Nucleotide-binding protein G3O08_01755 n=1 Tax=Cryomorpha ignava TaxID=101383 RepID=A0A7K3WL21_9FLAO|nr:YajQ family cyclic di-GMP-binding protein [Cryomorpha ignava]NEN22228.1 YajQ family cyclic di-GMP-binding protein [Cryomorpha ignava]
MPSFDIVSEVDLQTVDNAINAAKKEIETRFDFKGTGSEVNLDKKNLVINLTTENDFRIDQMEKVLIGRFVKARIDPQSLDLSKEFYTSGKVVKKEIPVRQGIDRETAKKIVKAIKDAKIKVEVQIMDDKVRATSKSIDNLQETMAVCRQGDFGLALQYINMK